MKRLLTTIMMVAVCATSSADDSVIAATIREDGSTNTWTQTDLQDALGLMNRMYWRDMANDQGRRRWHGNRVGQYVFTNGTVLLRIDLYADGFVATNRADRKAAPRDPEAEAKAREEAARRAEEARRAWEEANLPPDLAAIRAAQRDAAQTQEVTVVVEGN